MSQPLHPEDLAAFEAAQWQFAARYPGLAAAALLLRPVPGPKLAVDTSWRVYMPPGWATAARGPELEALVGAAIWPLMLEHWQRGQLLPDKKRLQLASILETNEGLNSTLTTNAAALLRPVPAELGLPPGLYLEQIYERLPSEEGGDSGGEEPQEGDGDSEAPAPVQMDACSGNTGQPAPYELPPEQTPEELSAQVEWVRQEAAKHKGDLPGRLRERIQSGRAMLPPALLALAACLSALGSGTKRCRRQFNRRLPPRAPVLTPGSRRLSRRVIAILDTSLSMWGSELRQALSIINRLAQATDVTLYAGDTQTNLVRRHFRASASLEILGGGGTSMAAIIEDAVRREPPALVIVVTDGYTDWPAKPPRFPVVAVITERGTTQGIPPWVKWFRF